MKSEQTSDEIYGRAADEIKSVLINPTKSDFITKVISSIHSGFLPSERTDLAEKISHLSETNVRSFLWRRRESNPRPKTHSRNFLRVQRVY